MSLGGKKIILGVTGGIAAYKAAELARQLVTVGAQVQVVMTPAATRFITPQTLQALSGHEVRTDLWDSNAEAAMGHIELARWADVIVVAPATADFLARLRAGMADDLLTTLCLASEAPLLVAPAMNQAMWKHPASHGNAKQLRQRGVHFVGPASGDQACGDHGPGRMSQPEEIARAVDHLFKQNELLSGLRFLITAGPTYEDIDPVRFIGNRSSGRMGYALAAAARDYGAEVRLVSGPVHLAPLADIKTQTVRSAGEMHQVVMDHVEKYDVFIAAAAVADYRVATMADQKLKKQATDGLNLKLIQNPDILAQVAALKSPPYTVGFAAETDDLRNHAEQKRQRKGIDLIAANWVGQGRGFDREDNALLVLGDAFEQMLGQAPKSELAQRLLKIIAQRLAMKRGSA